MKKSLLLIVVTALMIGCGNRTNEPLIGNWIEVMPVSLDIVQGITLNKNGDASSIGMATLQYEKWSKIDDKLIMTGKSIGNGQTIDFTDTLNIVRLTPDSLILDKYGRYRITYYRVAALDSINPFNVLDSLAKVDYTTELETRVYKGLLTTESCVEAHRELTIYNYKNSGNGVYKLSNIYLRSDGETSSGNSYGRLYTLRGDAENPNAVVYQLVPFRMGGIVNFLYQSNQLLPLNDKLERTISKDLTLNLTTN